MYVIEWTDTNKIYIIEWTDKVIILLKCEQIEGNSCYRLNSLIDNYVIDRADRTKCVL